MREETCLSCIETRTLVRYGKFIREPSFILSLSLFLSLSLGHSWTMYRWLEIFVFSGFRERPFSLSFSLLAHPRTQRHRVLRAHERFALFVSLYNAPGCATFTRLHASRSCIMRVCGDGREFKATLAIFLPPSVTRAPLRRLGLLSWHARKSVPPTFQSSASKRYRESG